MSTGPGAIQADYKDTQGQAKQVPELFRQLWSKIYGQVYPYSVDPTTEFDLGESENAADYIVIYNYALFVRNAEKGRVCRDSPLIYKAGMITIGPLFYGLSHYTA
jgi:hypothetical protein